MTRRSCRRWPTGSRSAATLQPPLTTVHTSFYDFGARATEMLLDLIAHRVEGPQRVVLEAPLVVRASCGCRLA